MRIIIGSWFELPRLGRDAFALLMKQGVRYDRSLGFRLDIETDLSAAVRTISSALQEDVELVVRCFVCGKEACPGCPYNTLVDCDRTRVSPMCLCADHSPGEESFALYRRSFQDSLEPPS